jgi:hypothetical protein
MRCLLGCQRYRHEMPILAIQHKEDHQRRFQGRLANKIEPAENGYVNVTGSVRIQRKTCLAMVCKVC